ncbi:MAG: hypothetical protein Q8R53_01705 [Nanoarchaeota archaeon]|nr:hypothetical protein [Nanoarchaeota archaeon]
MGETTTNKKLNWKVKITANSSQQFADLEGKIDFLRNHISSERPVEAEVQYDKGIVDVELVNRCPQLHIHSPGHDGSRVDVNFHADIGSDCHVRYHLTLDKAEYCIHGKEISRG